MKKLILGSAALFFTLHLSAQTAAPPAPLPQPTAQALAVDDVEEKAREITREWTRDLLLTEDQQTVIRNVLIDNIRSKEAIKNDDALDKETAKVRYAELEANLDAQVHQVLTEEQSAKYTQIMNEKRAEKKEKKGDKKEKKKLKEKG